MQTRKLALIGLLLLGAASLAGLALWPIYVGRQAEAALNLPFYGQVGEWSIAHRVLTYERNNFRAQVRALLHIRGQGLDFEVPVTHQVHHRMLGNQLRTAIGPDWTAGRPPPPAVVALLAQAVPTAEAWLGLGGGLNARFFSQAFHIDRPDGRLGFLALGAVQGSLGHSGGRILFTFDTDTFGMADSRNTLTTERLNLGILVRLGLSGRYMDWVDYDVSLAVRDLELANQREVVLGARSLQLAAWQNSTQQRLDSLVRLRAEGTAWRGFESTKVETHITAHRLQRRAIAELFQDLRALYAEDVRDVDDVDDVEGSEIAETGARQLRMLGAFWQQLPLLATQDPLLQAELRLQQSSGADLHLALNAGLDSDPERWRERPWEAVRVEADLAWERELIAEMVRAWDELVDWHPSLATTLEKWLDDVIADGWFMLVDDRYSAQARLAHGRLLINDRDRSILLLGILLSLLRSG